MFQNVLDGQNGVLWNREFGGISLMLTMIMEYMCVCVCVCCRYKLESESINWYMMNLRNEYESIIFSIWGKSSMMSKICEEKNELKFCREKR